MPARELEFFCLWQNGVLLYGDRQLSVMLGFFFAYPTSQRVIALHDFKHYEPKTVRQSGVKLKLDNEASRWMERNFGHDIFLLFFCPFLFLMAAVSCAVQTPPPCAALVMKRTATRSLMPPTNESRQRWSNQSIATLLSPTHTSQMKKKREKILLMFNLFSLRIHYWVGWWAEECELPVDRTVRASSQKILWCIMEICTWVALDLKGYRVWHSMSSFLFYKSCTLRCGSTVES